MKKRSNYEDKIQSAPIPGIQRNERKPLSDSNKVTMRPTNSRIFHIFQRNSISEYIFDLENDIKVSLQQIDKIVFQNEY